MEPFKISLKQSTQKKEGKKTTNQPLALDNDHLEIMLHNHIESIVV
jgi:predicted metalloenzyme YecM